jgi:hypothetical protein
MTITALEDEAWEHHCGAPYFAGMLDCRSMRRVLILGLVLSIVATGLVPLSTCALISARVAECAQLSDPSPCDHMDSKSGETQISRSADQSCCVISQAPLPEFQFNEVQVGPAVTIAEIQNALQVPIARAETAFVVVENSSPSSFQSLLCTFLI